MANKMKYSEEKLCEAVKKFATEHRVKIKASELALWAAENMEMEEVRAYHFLRPKVSYIEGKRIEAQRECTRLIEDINRNRMQLFSSVNNVILSATSIDDFFALKESDQRKAIVSVRENFKELAKNNLRLQIENDVVNSERKTAEKQMRMIEGKIRDLEKETNKAIKLCRFISQTLTDQKCTQICSNAGIENENIDLIKYEESIHDFESVALDFRDILKRYCTETAEEKLEVLLGDTLDEISEYVRGTSQ